MRSRVDPPPRAPQPRAERETGARILEAVEGLRRAGSSADSNHGLELVVGTPPAPRPIGACARPRLSLRSRRAHGSRQRRPSASSRRPSRSRASTNSGAGARSTSSSPRRSSSATSSDEALDGQLRMPERQLEIAEGVTRPTPRRRGCRAPRTATRASAACARHARPCPRATPAEPRPASDIASSVACPVSVASRMASVKFASARAHDAAVVAWSTRDVEEHRGQRADPGCAAHLVDERAQTARRWSASRR